MISTRKPLIKGEVLILPMCNTRYGAGLQPLKRFGSVFLGRCPRLVLSGPSALKSVFVLLSTEGAFDTGLGRRPRKTGRLFGQG